MVLEKQNYLLWLTNVCLNYRKASSDLPEMFSSTILHGVNVSQEMLSFTVLLLGVNDNSVFLGLLFLFFILISGMVNKTLFHICGR